MPKSGNPHKQCSRTRKKRTTKPLRMRPATFLLLSRFALVFSPSAQALACAARKSLLLFRKLLPQLFSALHRRAGCKILHLIELPNFDLALLVRTMWRRDALGPFNRLRLRFHLDDPVARDQFFGLGERSIDHGWLATREPDARAFGTRLQPA